MSDLRQVIVTGGSSGIGRAICERLLGLGYEVVGVARDFSKYRCDHHAFHGIGADLSDLEALPECLDQIVNRYPAISGLVCCAGAGRFGSLEQFSYEQIQWLINLNLTSQMFVARALLPVMKRAQRGDLIFIGSEAGITGGRRGAVYSATKFAVRGLAQSLREECAASDVRVSIVNPGMVKTPFFDELDFQPGANEDNYIEPDDVADAVISILAMRRGTVIDEVNLSPLKKVIRFKQET